MKRATQHRADKNTVISVIVTTHGLLHLSHQRQSGWRSPGGSVFVTSSSYTSVCPLIHGDNLQALSPSYTVTILGHGRATTHPDLSNRDASA